jgi:hypothetical protein
MDQLLRSVEWILPACMSFGPLFMIMVARGDTDRRSRWTRGFNYLGLGMFMLALMWLNLALVVQRGKVSVLDVRVSLLEKRLEEHEKPCPGVAP